MYLTKKIGMVNKLMSSLSYERANLRKYSTKASPRSSSPGVLNTRANVSTPDGFNGGFSYNGYSKTSMRLALYSNIRKN